MCGVRCLQVFDVKLHTVDRWLVPGVEKVDAWFVPSPRRLQVFDVELLDIRTCRRAQSLMFSKVVCE